MLQIKEIIDKSPMKKLINRAFLFTDKTWANKLRKIKSGKSLESMFLIVNAKIKKDVKRKKIIL